MCGNDSQENGDVESPAATAGSASGHPVNSAVLAFRRLAIAFVRRYNRLEVSTAWAAPGGPVLFVANHGFGGIFDLNVFAVGAAFERLELERDVIILTHQVAWTLGVGSLISRSCPNSDHYLAPARDIAAFQRVTWTGTWEYPATFCMVTLCNWSHLTSYSGMKSRR